MTYSDRKQIQMISSIPGRMRIQIRETFKNEELGYGILRELTAVKGIMNAIYNQNTGSFLIIYQTEDVDEALIIGRIRAFKVSQENDSFVQYKSKNTIENAQLQAFNPLNIIRKRYHPVVFEKEYALSRRLLKLEIVMGAALFGFAPTLGNILSIGILSYPGILFAVASAAYHYTAGKAKVHDIYLQQDHAVGLFIKTKKLMLEDHLLVNPRSERIQTGLKPNDYMDIQKKVIIGNMKDPIKPEARLLICRMREYGVTDFVVLTDKKDDIIKYLTRQLDIKDVKLMKDGVIQPLSSLEKEFITVMVPEQKYKSVHKAMGADLWICIFTNPEELYNKGDINVTYFDMANIPWLFKISKHTEERIVRGQTSAMTIHILAMLFTLMRGMHPLLSLGIYGLNTFLQLSILKNNINHENGVLYEYSE